MTLPNCWPARTASSSRKRMASSVGNRAMFVGELWEQAICPPAIVKRSACQHRGTVCSPEAWNSSQQSKTWQHQSQVRNSAKGSVEQIRVCGADQSVWHSGRLRAELQGQKSHLRDHHLCTLLVLHHHFLLGTKFLPSPVIPFGL